MTVIQITCDNCGAKYKLPETFTGSQAKCQKCGSVIDVQKQRPQAAGAAPAAAAAKPAAAAARPAVDRSKEAPKVDRPARPARAGKAEAGADDATKGRRVGREKPEAKKANNMPLVLGGIGLLAVIVVVVLMMRGGDKPNTDTTAKANPAAPNKPAEQPSDKPAEKPPEAPAKPAEKPAEKPADKPAEPADKPVEKPAEAPAAKPPEAAPADASTAAAEAATKRPWEKMKNPPASMAEVADPKSYGEVKWPESVDEAARTEIRGLVDDVKNGGRAGITAKPKLVKHDYAALFGIVDGLRTLDYKSAEDSMVAFELNKVLEQITGGLNARFEAVEAGEVLAPAKAEWNTRSVKGWLGMLDQFPDAETFRKGRAERLKKQEAK